MERESFKGYSEAAIVEKRAFSGEILLRETSLSLSMRGDFFFFGRQNRRSAVLEFLSRSPGTLR